MGRDRNREPAQKFRPGDIMQSEIKKRPGAAQKQNNGAEGKT